MDLPNFSHDGHHGYPTGQVDGHWQPALRATEGYSREGERIPATHHISQAGFEDDSLIMEDTTEEDVEVVEEEDEQAVARAVDPAWGLARADTAHFLDTVHRTSSFPVLPPQAKLTDVKSDSNALNQQDTANPPPEPLPSLDEAREVRKEAEPLESAHDLAQPTFHDQLAVLNGQNVEQVPDYEEGLSLVQADQLDLAAHLEDSMPAETFSQTQLNDDGHLPGQSQMLAHSAPPALERKHTEEVLSVLGIEKDKEDETHLVRSDSKERSRNHPPSMEDAETTAFDGIDQTDDFSRILGADKNEEDPWAAVADGEDDFLIEDADDLLPDSDEEPMDQLPQKHDSRATSNSTSLPTPAPGTNPYAPHQPSTSDFAQFNAAPHTQSTISRALPPFQAPGPVLQERGESFADRAKGGYKSPYDLPMDIAPKRKAQAVRAPIVVNNRPPPPRTSSIGAESQILSPTSPAYSRPSIQSPMDRAASAAAKAPRTADSRSASGFFEELPIVTKPRAMQQRPSSMQSPPVPTRQPSIPPQIMPQSYLPQPPPQIVQQPRQQTQSQDLAQFGLHQPARLDPYSGAPLQPQQPSVPTQSARYSPAPPSVQAVSRPSQSPRYSPAPQQMSLPTRYASQPSPLPTPPIIPFQPRTSSPLAPARKSVDAGVAHITHHASASMPSNMSTPTLPVAPMSPPQIDPSKIPQTVPPKRSQTQSPGRQMARSAYAPRMTAASDRPASAFVPNSSLDSATSMTRTSQLQRTRTSLVPEVEYMPPADETRDDPLQRWKGAPIIRFGFGGRVLSSFPLHTPRFSAQSIRPQMSVSSGGIKVRKFQEIHPQADHIAKFPGPLKGKSKKKDILTWMLATITSFEAAVATMPSSELHEKIMLWKIVRIMVENDGSLESPQARQAINTVLMPDVYVVNDQSSSTYQPGDSSSIYQPAGSFAKPDSFDAAAVEKLRKLLLKGRREEAVWQAVDSRLWSHAFLLASTLERKIWKQVVQEFVKQEVRTTGANAESLSAFYEVVGGNSDDCVDQLVPPSARAGLQFVSRVDTAATSRNALDGLNKWRETLCLILNNRSAEDGRALMSLGKLLLDYGRVEASHICYLFARTAFPSIFGGADDPATAVVLLGSDHKINADSFNADTDSILLTEVLEFTITTLAASSSGLPLPYLAAYKLQHAAELADVDKKSEAQAYCDFIASGLTAKTKQSPYYHAALFTEVESLASRIKSTPIQGQSWIAKPSIEKVSGSVWNKFTTFVTGEDSDADSKGSTREVGEAGPFAGVTGSPTISRNVSQTDLYGSMPAVANTTAGSRYAPNGTTSARSSSELTRGRASLEMTRSPPSTSHSNASQTQNLFVPAQPPQSQSTGLSSSPQFSLMNTPSLARDYSPRPAAQRRDYSPRAAPQTRDYSPRPSIAAARPPSQSAYVPAIRKDQPSVEPDHKEELDLTEDSNETVEQINFGYNPSAPELQPLLPDSHIEPQDDALPEIDQFEQTSYGGYAPPEDTGYQPYMPEPDSEDDEPVIKPKKKSYMDDEDDYVSNQASTSTMPPPPRPESTASANSEAARKKANDEAADAAFRAAAEADAKAAEDSKHKVKASGSWLGGWFGGAKRSDSLDDSSSKKSASKDQKVHRVHLGESKMKLYYDKEKGKWINPDNPDTGETKKIAPPPRSMTPAAPPRMPQVQDTGARSVSSPVGGMPPPINLGMGSASRSGTPLSQAVESDGESFSRPGTSSNNIPISGIAATLPPSTGAALGLGSTPPSRPQSTPSTNGVNATTGLDDLLGGTAGGRRVSGLAAKKARKKGAYVDVMAGAK